jgi:hypothetical protein
MLLISLSVLLIWVSCASRRACLVAYLRADFADFAADFADLGELCASKGVPSC